MKYLHKDITTVEEGVIIHGVNCQGVMGAGVAKALYTKWPRVREEYLHVSSNHASGRRVKLGQIQEVSVVDPDWEDKIYGVVVVNAFTQEDYGNDGKQYASPAAIAIALAGVASSKELWESGLLTFPIHMPRIGCGLGGIAWKDVEPIVAILEEIHNLAFNICDWP